VVGYREGSARGRDDDGRGVEWIVRTGPDVGRSMGSGTWSVGPVS
jgi:hypothetical protein